MEHRTKHLQLRHNKGRATSQEGTRTTTTTMRHVIGVAHIRRALSAGQVGAGGDGKIIPTTKDGPPCGRAVSGVAVVARPEGQLGGWCGGAELVQEGLLALDITAGTVPWLVSIAT